LGYPKEYARIELAEAILQTTGSKSKIQLKELPEDDRIKKYPDI